MMTFSSRVICIIALLSVTSACSSGASGGKSSVTQDEPAVQESELQNEQEVLGNEPQPSVQDKVEARVPSECPVHSVLGDHGCICGLASISLLESSGWACFGDYWRCLLQNGCRAGDTRVPQYSDLKSDGVWCGDMKAPGDVSEYLCSSHKNWVCNDSSCDCVGTEILRNQICSVDGVLCVEKPRTLGCECGNKVISPGWSCLDRKPSCGGITFDFGDNQIQGTCEDGMWIYPQVDEMSFKYQERQSTLRLDRHGSAVIHDGQIWCVDDALPWDAFESYQCDDIGWNFGKKWVCREKDGCVCGEQKCRSGQICSEGKCRDSVQLCEKGNCKCGKGSCAAGAWCVDGHCFCADGDFIERFPYEIHDFDERDLNVNNKYWGTENINSGRDIYIFEGNRYGSFVCNHEMSDGTCFIEANVLECKKKNGCYTTDGRHYAYGDSSADLDDLWNSENHTSAKLNEVHVDTGFIVKQPAWVGREICVIPRNDGLLLMHDAGDGAKSFICDQDRCRCGKHHCSFGELCMDGKCQKDSCKITPEILQLAQPDCDENDDLGGADCADNMEPVFSAKECPGGTKYCFGLKDEPIAAPENFDGYACKSLDKLKESADHMAWVCTDDDGCPCGGSLCPHGSACIDDVCKCNGAVVQDRDKTENCVCGNSGIECQKIEVKSKDSVDENPDFDGEGSDNTENDVLNRCVDIAKPVSSDGYVCSYQGADSEYGWKCMKGEGCLCGKQTCPTDAVCRDEQCFCGSELAIQGYSCINDRNICMNKEGCACGNKVCSLDSSCSGGECYCGNDPILDSDTKEYACTVLGYRTTWVCTKDEGCACGTTHCTEHAVCDQGSCVCKGIILPPDAGYTCGLSSRYEYDSVVPICTRSGGCACEDSMAAINETCEALFACPANSRIKDGQCICGDQVLPGKNYLCEARDDGRLQLVCNENYCACGDSICPKYSVCSEGKCLNPSTDKPIPVENGYLTDGLMKLCTQETCACAFDECHQGDFCYLGQCWQPEIAFDQGRYIMGHTVQNDEVSSHDPVYWSEKYKQYGFVVEINSVPYCSSYEYDFSWKDQCALETGCDCGKNHCPFLSFCTNGICDYSSSDYQDLCREVLDDDGNCPCSGTKILLPHFDFACRDAGWVCEGARCDCGKISCKVGEICVKPDLCVPGVEVPKSE